MRKQGKLIAPLLCAILPLIPLSYLYTRNAEYLSAVQVGVVGAAMAAVSLVGYLLLRLIFRSRLSAFAGCAVVWVLFFALKGAVGWAVDDRKLFGFGVFLALYAAAAILLALVIAFATRKAKADWLFPVLSVFLVVFLVMNAVPAVKTGIMSEQEAASIDTSKYKTQFNVLAETPSPNVYWFHCDGMLGFDAFEKYFGDDQAEFAQALADRGFQIDRGAMFEANHTTKIAVPALLCPNYYDTVMQGMLKDNETASTVAAKSLTKGDLQYARVKNETRLAFEQKGYLSQTIGSINSIYPPVTGRVYAVGGAKDAFTLEREGDFEQEYLSIIEAGELATLLTGIQNGMYISLAIQLGERGMLGFPLRRAELEHPLPAEDLQALFQGKNLGPAYRAAFSAINDATYAGQPTFNTVFYVGAHYPFTLDAEGKPQTGDPGDIHSYVGQHRYAAAMLTGMIDLILSRDPDAVIVLQADHGLHGQSREQITAAFGEEAVVPIWDQVMSALRVPEKYKNGEESAALISPLNMSRYLVNAFVGKNYAYIQ
jgi:hypothetical protein